MVMEYVVLRRSRCTGGGTNLYRRHVSPSESGLAVAARRPTHQDITSEKNFTK
jgi:hypothetical protein